MAIPKSKDPIALELETICTSRLAVPVSFVHANMNEANFGLDQMSDEQFPVLVYITGTRNKADLDPSHNIRRTARLNVLLLNRLPLDTLEFKSGEVNQEVNFMRQLGENLIYWINRSRYSVNGGVEKFDSDEVYQRFDAHLFGQALSFDWVLDTGETGYYNNPGTV